MTNRADRLRTTAPARVRMHNLVKAALLSVALTAGVTLVSAEPAGAAPTDCGFGLGCTWTLADWTGVKSQYSFSGSGGTGHCVNVSARRVQSISDTYGNPVAGIAIFELPNCQALGRFVPTFQAVSLATPFTMESYELLSNS